MLSASLKPLKVPENLGKDFCSVKECMRGHGFSKPAVHRSCR